MTAQNKVPYVWTQGGVAMCLNGRPYNFAKEDSLFPDIVSALREGKPAADILAIIEAPAATLKNATKITNDVSIEDGIVYYKGEAIHSSLADRMVGLLNEGYDLVPMANFLSNLMDNPSRSAVQELYSFLEKGAMPITPDGHFMAYKAVRADYKDIHSGTYDNSVGKVCEMPRNQVDDNRERTCSYGLHFCSFEYLPHFSHANGHVMLVKINPRDVVSIPADYNDTKGRCSRYEVVGEYEGYYKEFGPAFSSMLYDPEHPNHNGCEDYDDDGYDDSDDGVFVLYGLEYEGQPVDEAEMIDEYDDLTQAKHDAVDYISDYAMVVVVDRNDDQVFSIRGR